VDTAFAITTIVFVVLTVATARAYVGIRRFREQADRHTAASAV
jgi:ABC-type transport system involved in Fe-S cluster assembly fused permease/ATPase subunit